VSDLQYVHLSAVHRLKTTLLLPWLRYQTVPWTYITHTKVICSACCYGYISLSNCGHHKLLQAKYKILWHNYKVSYTADKKEQRCMLDLPPARNVPLFSVKELSISIWHSATCNSPRMKEAGLTLPSDVGDAP